MFGSELAHLPDFNLLEKTVVTIYGSISAPTVTRYLVFKHFALRYFQREGIKHKKILDFGCAFGGFGFLLARKHCDASVYLYDVKPEAEKKCKLVIDLGHYKNVRFLRKDELTKESGFSLTLLGDVLEHIEDDRGTLADIYARMMPGGFLYITVPTFRETQPNAKLLHGHVRGGYELTQLQRLLGEAGFTIVLSPDVRTVNGSVFFSILDKAYRKLTKVSDSLRFDFHTLPLISFPRKAALALIWPFYRLAMEYDIIAHGVQLKSIVILAQRPTSGHSS